MARRPNLWMGATMISTIAPAPGRPSHEAAPVARNSQARNSQTRNRGSLRSSNVGDWYIACSPSPRSMKKTLNTTAERVRAGSNRDTAIPRPGDKEGRGPTARRFSLVRGTCELPPWRLQSRVAREFDHFFRLRQHERTFAEKSPLPNSDHVSTHRDCLWERQATYRPCIRHRPFGMGGDWHGLPLRVPTVRSVRAPSPFSCQPGHPSLVELADNPEPNRSSIKIGIHANTGLPLLILRL